MVQEDDDLATVIWEALASLKWQAGRLSKAAGVSPATVSKYLGRKRPRGDVRTISRIGSTIAPELRRSISAGQFDEWMRRWVTAVVDLTGLDDTTVEASLLPSRDRTRGRRRWDNPREALDELRRQSPAMRRQVAIDVVAFLKTLRPQTLSRADALAMSDCYYEAACIMRDASHPAFLLQIVEPILDCALWVLLCRVRDANREALIDSQRVLVKGMLARAQIFLEPSASVDFTEIDGIVRKALPGAERWARSELERHRATCEIFYRGDNKTFRGSMEAARKDLSLDTTRPNYENGSAELILNDIEARGVLRRCPEGSADIVEAEGLVQTLNKAQLSEPLRRLQRKYLQITLRACCGDPQAPVLAAALWFDPDWEATPYQAIRIYALNRDVADIVASRPRWF